MPLSVFVASLGCDKNLVDTEHMMALLSEKGYTFTDDESEADIILVNTCCFIGDAKEESIQTILELAQLKQTGRCRLLLAAGCLAQRYGREVLAELPEVDGLVGTTAWDQLPDVLEEALAAEEGHPHDNP